VTATLPVAPATGPSPGDDGSSRHRTRSGVWAAMAAPGTLWLVLLFVVPVYAILAVAFGSIDPVLRTTAPQWNPLAWDFTAFGNILERVVDRDDLGKVFIRTGTRSRCSPCSAAASSGIRSPTTSPGRRSARADCCSPCSCCRSGSAT
jgi:hypothetical protein